MSVVLAYTNRNCTRDVTIKDVNGITIVPQQHDKVRATIKREGEEAVLTVTSDAATANGSSFTKGSKCRLRLDASDLTFEPGTYSLVIDYFDNADAQEWKFASREVFVLEDL